MSRWLGSLGLQRVLLPIALATGSVLRQNGLSGIYLLLLLYNPFVPVPTSKTMAGHAGRYLKTVIFFTIFNILSSFAFQIILLAQPPYGSIIHSFCDPLERWLRYAGLVRFDGINVWDGIRMLAPEVLVLAVATSVYMLCTKLNPPGSVDEQLLPLSVPQPQPAADEAAAARKLALLTEFGKYVCLSSLCFAGILRPSALSGIYFLCFLGCMTWWACNIPLGKPFAYFCRFLQPLVAAHVIALYLYQMQWAQELLPSEDPIPRYLGLTSLVETHCDDPRVCHLVAAEWASFVSPVALVWLYFILWYESNMILSTPGSFSASGQPLNNNVCSETTPLIRGRESVYRRGGVKRSIIQDSSGGMTITEVPEEVSEVESIKGEEPSGPGALEIMINAGITIIELLAQSSYIATNIIMMAWSITYHSWLTFVLLLWASVMWLMPNQRRAMLRSSPFLVFYATCLLLAQYIYGMNLTDEELPQTVQDLNLKQIGLEKITHLPVIPLLIKTLFSVMFWITLKQYNQERADARAQATASGAPVSPDMEIPMTIMTEPQTQTSQLVQRIGRHVRSILTKFWIWVVASILFAIGITGDRMTIFRIVYMALALIFVLTFQLSWVVWRKMMYGFWLTVIIYSMLILVMTYTYQFDNFPKYWEIYLRIPPTLQQDIGLERFETTELFVKLLTPTFFVVITVIQLYYFHKDFLAISDIKSRGSSSVRPRVSDGSTAPPRSEGSSVGVDFNSSYERKESEVKSEAKRSIHFIQSLKQLRLQIQVQELGELLDRGVELTWLFMELHMLKFIILAIMLLAVYDVCAMHLLFVIMAVVSLMFGSNFQIMTGHATSVLVSILLLAKMIYQIKYIKHDSWNVTCTEKGNVTYNTAEWIGFYKIDKDNSLPHLLQGYIGVILIVTFQSVVATRQKYQRHLRGRPLSRPYVMFPRITFKEVDKDLTHCIKYLFNYAFYRFGVEICLIAVVALIGTRMDLYAIFYSLWLIILITPRRALLSKIWPIFTIFIVFTIPLQYALVVGLPPALCVTYPWNESEILQRVQEWMFFPDPQNPPPSYKLLCDFIVLLLVSRQSVAFRIERRHHEREYAGGTNKSITGLLEQPGFRNPTPDFISHTRSWLDVVKRVVLSAFIWITLAIVFLSGTSRVNLFSLGYLIGAFIFLWQGNDFYLRPIDVILRWWNHLIKYNVSVILIKAVLQILGCIFIKEMQNYACWVVQLLGIACIKKFTLPSERIIPDPVSCVVPPGDVGLAWDGFCFGFLILQRRLFNSYYFFRIIDEAKAMTILASRGAELIEELSQKQIREQQETERKILEKIKNKMDRIKASQQKIQDSTYKEPESHSIAGAPLAHDSTPSISSPASPQGFHTPIEEEVPPRNSFLQAPTPTSAILSRSLEGYLEPQRMSFGSPPPSDLHRAPSFDDSFPVFSPPPYGAVVMARQPRGSGGGIGPPWLNSFTTPRQSIISNSSPRSHHTSIRSGDYYMFDDVEEELDLISEQDSETSEAEDSEEAVDKSRTDVFKLLSSAMKTDIEKATEMARRKSKAATAAIRRSSMPHLRKGSSASTSFSVTHKFEPELTIWRSCASLPESPDTESKPGTSKSIIPERILCKRLEESDTDEDVEKAPALKMDGKDGKETPPLDGGGGGDQAEKDQEEDGEPKDQSLLARVLTVLSFLWAFVNSVMVTITRYLNKFSRDYRYVMRTLSVEKKQLKENPDFGAGVRPAPSHVWQPLPSVCIPKVKSSRAEPGYPSTSEDITSDPMNSRDEAFPPDVSQRPIEPEVCEEAMLETSPVCLEDLEDERELSAADQPPAIRLLLALWFAVISHSELVCYFTIFLHQIRSPTVLSLPLPLMVFLWGTLTVPRPSKTFWVTIIAYTEIVVVVKCMFQFEILPWNQQVVPDNYPFFPPRIIGVEKQRTMFAYYDLLLLLIVFFHRSMLKSLGLWKSTMNGNKEKGSPVSETTEVEVSEKEPKLLQVGGGDVSLTVPPLPSSKKTPSEDMENSSKDYFPGILPLQSSTYLNPFKKFFRNLLDPACRVTADVYAYMFFCDFFNFLVVIFGFASFGSQQGDGGVSQYFEENKVPVAFLVMLILQFGLIIVDRTLYLRKYILGKIIFQFILVIGIHVWMFFVLPAVTDRQFNAALPPQMWYMVKCFYLLLSAYQIRSGYPTRILGNFLCKSYNYINMFLFKVFMAVPFVFELRALMDWIWTDTSMTLSDWLKMEDIFAHIFQLKCQRRAETEYPQPRGQKKASFHKYLVGGGCLVGIIAVIWFPLVLFALGNTVGQPNLPKDVTISLKIGAYQPIYTYSVQKNAIETFSLAQWDTLSDRYRQSRAAQTFLSNYDFDDVGVVSLSTHSTSVWTISPPDNITLIEEVESNKNLTIGLEWVVSRATTSPEQPGTASNRVEVNILPGNPTRKLLVDVLTGKQPNGSVVFPDLFPKFLKITSRGTATAVPQLLVYDDDHPPKSTLRNLSVALNGTEGTRWWEVEEDCKDSIYKTLLKFLPFANCSKLVMYTFNDKAFPATLNIISGKGIIGLYTTFVIVIHSVIRGFFTGISFKIMFDDMPNVDRILQLCLDIYLVRESGELDLEEDLFAKLVFLYRSPETLIKWTRPPEEVGEDEENQAQLSA